MASLLALFGAAILTGVSAGVLRGSAPLPPSPIMLPTPPLREMVIIPYESPETVSARLSQMALRGSVDECLKNDSVLVLGNTLSFPVPLSKHSHLLRKSHTNSTKTLSHQLL